MPKKELIPYPNAFTRGLLRLPIALQRSGLGGLLGLTSLMVLTTRGRKSGLPRYTALEYRRHGSKLYVVSGFGTRPNWYQNLVCDPNVTLKIGRQVYSARAYPVEDRSEALRALYMFRRMLSILGMSDFDLHRNRSETEILGGYAVRYYELPDVVHEYTIVRFELCDTPGGLPAIPADRVWVWPALAALGLLIGAIRRK